MKRLLKKTIQIGKRSFTLVEMLVVVSALWVLTMTTIPNVLQSQGKARDAARKYDITQISQALNVLYFDKWTYPTNIFNTGAWGRETSLDTWWMQTLQGKYLSTIPKDPLNTYTNLYPWLELQRWNDYMYVYAFFESWYVWNPLYTCSMKQYAIISATNFEYTAPWMRPSCPWYDWSTLVDFGFVLAGGNVYTEYKSIGTGTTTTTQTWSETQTWSQTQTGGETGGSTTPTPLSNCPNTAAALSVWSRLSCYCPPQWVSWDPNIWWTNEYTSSSSMCIAAMHAWMNAVWAGGNTTILVTPWRSTYVSSTQHGITSKAKKNGSTKSYRFYAYEEILISNEMHH